MDQILCPVCPVTKKVINLGKTPREIEVGSWLQITEHNYSGTGADMAHCPKCDSNFWISYKVDEITKIS
jgi:hypothetical protein